MYPWTLDHFGTESLGRMTKKKEFAFTTFCLLFLPCYSVGGKFELLPSIVQNCLKSEKINYLSFVFVQFASDNELEEVVNMVQNSHSLFYGK